MNKPLLEKQIAFLDSDVRITLFMGGIGSGKTLIGAWWCIMRALKGRKVIALEPTNQMCRDVFLVTLKEVLEEIGLVQNEDYFVSLAPSINIEFFNGGIIHVRSAEAAERLRGINANDGYIDEFGSLLTDEPYKILLGRLRKSKDAQIRLTGTPSVYPWIKKLTKTEGVELIRQTTIDNYFLPQTYIDSLKETYGIDTPWYRQEVLGEIVDFTSGIVDPVRFIQGPFNGQAKLFVRAWDFASSGKTTADFTACVAMSIDDKNNVYIHDVMRRRGNYGTIKTWIKDTIKKDQLTTIQVWENTQAGQVIVSDLQTDQDCYGVHWKPVNAIRDKVTRALPFAAALSQNKVTIAPIQIWEDYKEECSLFSPNAVHDDMVDATAHAYNYLIESIKHRASTFVSPF